MNAPQTNREFAVEVVQRLREAGYASLWAGGCVRDLLLDRPPGDYDVASSATPDQVREVFGKRRTIPVGASFGVMIVRGPHGIEPVEVATFRTEGTYADGRRPDHVEFSTPEEDAQRRDFTINGMFYDPITEKVIDYVGGEADLQAKSLRAIGNPQERMTEDKLRMLRAVRFAATLGFDLDADTADAVREMADQIHVVSAERIAQEFRRMLVDPNRQYAITLADELDLLLRIIPQLDPVWQSAELRDRTLSLLEQLDAPDFPLALAGLLHGLAETTEPHDSRIVRRVGKALRLSNQEIDAAAWLVGHQYVLDEAPALDLAQLKRALAQPLVQDQLALAGARRTSAGEPADPIAFCARYLQETSADEINPQPLISGDDLIKLGLAPGKQFKQLLDQVRDDQLRGDLVSREDAIEWVRTHIAAGE